MYVHSSPSRSFTKFKTSKGCEPQKKQLGFVINCGHIVIIRFHNNYFLSRTRYSEAKKLSGPAIQAAVYSLLFMFSVWENHERGVGGGNSCKLSICSMQSPPCRNDQVICTDPWFHPKPQPSITVSYCNLPAIH